MIHKHSIIGFLYLQGMLNPSISQTVDNIFKKMADIYISVAYPQVPRVKDLCFRPSVGNICEDFSEGF